jgi:Uncharacterized Fe-S protein
MITLSRLYIHPVKSMRGLQLSHAQVLESGLAFDRIFMVTELDGTFITARQYPDMVRFYSCAVTGWLIFKCPGWQPGLNSLQRFHGTIVTH